MNAELSVQSLLGQMRLAATAGQWTRAEALCAQILAQDPQQVEAVLWAAGRATAARRLREAEAVLARAYDGGLRHEEVSVQLALARAALGDLEQAMAPLKETVTANPEHHEAWLLLSLVRERMGDARGSLEAAYQAVTRAQQAGLWLNEATTPAKWFGPVVKAIERVRTGRRELFLDVLSDLRTQYGPSELVRMEHAIASYLGDVRDTPPSPHQKPIFFYFPGLPATAYHDPYLQPWAKTLRDAFPEIREDALDILAERGQGLPDFLPKRPPEAPDNHLGGDSADPTWQGFFFYRRGTRFAEHHARCPRTSAALESLDLCRIPDQAPEILFSVLRPATHIRPHHGTSNIRLVMHLPLVIPRDCALNIFGGGTHHWKEGELVMFDDTYLHEAWNRSDTTRVIVLMDCWNPHLSEVERAACIRFIDMVGSLRGTRAPLLAEAS